MGSRLRSLLVALFRRSRVETEMDEELRFHIAARAEDLMRSGEPRDVAFRSARIAFGSLANAKESCREARGLRLLDELRSDFQLAIRSLIRTPGVTVFAILALALGIGANTAIFSVVHSVLLRPLPFPNSDRLVMIWESDPASGFARNTPAPGNMADWRDQSTVFTGVAATHSASAVLGPDQPEEVLGRSVVGNLFQVLGARPVLGRVFTEAEDNPNVTIISDSLWKRRFQGDPGVINRQILMNGAKATVVGVMPPDFVLSNSEIEFWSPSLLTPEQLAARDSHFLQVVARLKPGVSVQRAQAEINTIMARLAEEYAATNKNRRGTVIPLQQDATRESRRLLIILALASVLVLLIACSNVASILLTRAASRTREHAIRLALGSGGRRLVRALLVESLVLSLAGCLAGIVFAYASLPLLARLVPRGLERWMRPEIDVAAIAAAFVLAAVATLAAGISPVFLLGRANLNDLMKQGGRTGVNAHGNRTRGALVVAEVAFSVVLLCGASLLIQSMARLDQEPLGFRRDHVLAVRTRLPRPRYAEYNRRIGFYDAVLERVRKLPGVVDAGYTSTLPFLSAGNTSGFEVQGRPPFQPGEERDALTRVVTPGYMRALQFELVAGRLLAESDRAGAPLVVVINETFARQQYGGANPIGRRIKAIMHRPEDPWQTIVGVVRDVKERGYDLEMKQGFYLPTYQMETWTPQSLAIRYSGTDVFPVAPVVAAIHEVDPEQPVAAVQTMDEVIARAVAGRGNQTRLMAAFAGLALILAALGIYAVLSYRVSLRQREIGVRIALGARQSQVAGAVVRDGLAVTALGLAIGLASAAAFGSALASVLYRVSPYDAPTYAAVAITFAIVAAFAAWIPARRAASVAPAVVLRDE